ncbi:hypothetical protein SDC9_75589 [bioreactor metagenome]|uniref:Uncharacterized protein n=1 Tax=bioreactor metagenome TaxID=1076179 RepID=A0A644YKY7_9ZZZZ
MICHQSFGHFREIGNFFFSVSSLFQAYFLFLQRQPIFDIDLLRERRAHLFGGFITFIEKGIVINLTVRRQEIQFFQRDQRQFVGLLLQLEKKFRSRMCIACGIVGTIMRQTKVI